MSPVFHVAEDIRETLSSYFDLASEVITRFGVSPIGEGREADEVGEEHRHQPAFGDRSRGRSDRRGSPVTATTDRARQSSQQRRGTVTAECVTRIVGGSAARAECRER